MNPMITLSRMLFSRRLWMMLACILLIVVVTVGINVAGIRALGSIGGWESWLEQHRLYFLVWRLCLYGATASGWFWMRKRVLMREPETGTTARFYRTEGAAVIVVLALETTSWLQAA